MLLRRIAQHVREQNWMAVALDFLIVVLGVVIGLQVSNWNDQRRETAIEQQTLTRLLNESEDIVRYWQEAVTHERENDLALEASIAALSDGSLGDLDEKEFARGLMRATRYSTPAPPQIIVSELVQAGASERISSYEVRAALSLYQSRLDFIDGQLDNFRDTSAMLDQLEQQPGWTVVYDASVGTRRRVDVDFKALASNPDLLEALVEALRNQIVFHTYRVRALKAAEGLCIAVANELRQACKETEADAS